jgi:hypothetical protein
MGEQSGGEARVNGGLRAPVLLLRLGRSKTLWVDTKRMRPPQVNAAASWLLLSHRAQQLWLKLLPLFAFLLLW